MIKHDKNVDREKNARPENVEMKPKSFSILDFNGDSSKTKQNAVNNWHHSNSLGTFCNFR